MSNPDPHRQVEQIFQDALDRDTNQRPEFLDAACKGNAALRKEVDALLEHFDRAAGSFLERPAPALEGVARDARPPQRVGPYLLGERIGEGGMGVVHEAVDETTGRQVALKLIHAGFHSASLLRRFRFEAEVLSRLDHPGIARVFEAGIATVGDGPGAREFPFLAMERIDGVPISRFVETQALASDAIVDLVARVGDAVHHAHAKGFIHRDLKPANVLVTPAGDPKVLDFGIARAVDPDSQRTFRTLHGELLGTLAYMSPEQVLGDPEAVDLRVDVYALGVLLFELLTGTIPYDIDGMDVPSAVRTMMETPPRPVRDFLPTVSRSLEQVLGAALAKDRDGRPPSAEALCVALRACAGDKA